MKRIRRNAFALGKKEDVVEVPNRSPEPPQLPVEEVFGMAPSEDTMELDHIEAHEDRPCPHLTQEQITGKVMKDVVKQTTL